MCIARRRSCFGNAATAASISAFVSRQNRSLASGSRAWSRSRAAFSCESFGTAVPSSRLRVWNPSRARCYTRCQTLPDVEKSVEND
jgi:hypothetical protein